MSRKIEDLEVEIFEWPDRFFVEAESHDRYHKELFPNDPDGPAPHLVDLSECKEGRCDCRDFVVNVEPFFNNEHHRTSCKHILAAQHFKLKHPSCPAKLPEKINL